MDHDTWTVVITPPPRVGQTLYNKTKRIYVTVVEVVGIRATVRYATAAEIAAYERARDGERYTTSAHEAARDEAMDAAAEGAERRDPGWQDRMVELVYSIARQKSTLTGPEVWADTPTCDKDIAERRALGPVMVAARKAGYIEPTGHFRPSVLMSSHMRPTRIWRSCVYGEAPSDNGEA